MFIHVKITNEKHLYDITSDHILLFVVLWPAGN